VKSYEEFFSWVLPEVAGCPEITALQSIRDSVIQFCELSLIHQVDHDPISVVAKIADYDIETPLTNYRVLKVMKAFYKGKELAPAGPDEVTDPALYNSTIGGYTPTYNTPTAFFQKDTTRITLMPIPDQTLALAITMRIALVPTRSSVGCEDFIFEQWVEPIAAGAVARLQLSSGRPYSNPQAARDNQARFMAGVNIARLRAVRGYNRSSLSVQLLGNP
jgi:hypothetical protein